MKMFKTFTEMVEKYNPENDHIFVRACELLDERLDGAVGEYGCDLHNYVFNEIFAFDNDRQKLQWIASGCGVPYVLSKSTSRTDLVSHVYRLIRTA